MMLRMCDPAGSEESRRFSPFCWRARFATAHKQPLDVLRRYDRKLALIRPSP